MNDITNQTNGYDATHEQTTPEALPAPRLDVLGAEATTKLGLAFAEHLEDVRAELKTIANELDAELKTTAENIREIAKLEADRIKLACARMRQAVLDAKALQERFLKPTPPPTTVKQAIAEAVAAVTRDDDPTHSDEDVIEPAP